MIGIQDFLKYRCIGDLTVSPDGKHAAYTVIQAQLERNGYTKEVWVTDIETAKSWRVLEDGSFTAFYWADADALCYLKPAFCGKTELFRKNIHSGDTQTLHTFPVETTEVWNVGGAYIARVQQQLIRHDYPEQLRFLADHEDGFETIDEIPLWDNGRGFISGKRSSLFGFDDSGAPVQLTHPHTNVDMVLETERGLYYTARTYRGQNTEPGIYFVTAAAEPVCLVPEGRYRISHIAVENGKLYFTGLDKTCTCMTDDHSFFCVEGGEVVRLPIPACSVDDSVSSDIRYGNNPEFEMKDGSFYYAFTGQWDSFVRRTTLDGHSEFLTPAGGSVAGFRLLPDMRILFVGMRGMKLQELYLWDGKEEIQLTHLNEAGLNPDDVIPCESFTFQNGGFNVNYTVLKPANFNPEKKYPAILYIHGGAKVLYTKVFFHEMQYLASEGYFVIYGNPRGSDGQGSDFARLLGHYGEPDFVDLMKAMDTALELYPNIDADRLGVAGGSYGGIMTNWMVTHTNRFKAAVAQRSICSMVSTFGTADNGFGFVREQMDGDLWNGFDNLWRQSPLKYADHCRTPLLLIHSDEDYRCHYTEAIQMFTALKYLGVESEVCLIRGENHSLSRTGRPVQRIKRLYEIERWFRRHLKEENHD